MSLIDNCEDLLFCKYVQEGHGSIFPGFFTGELYFWIDGIQMFQEAIFVVLLDDCESVINKSLP